MTSNAVLLVTAMAVAGCATNNSPTGLSTMLDTGANAVKAATLSDADMIDMAIQSRAYMDKKIGTAPPDNPYAKRLSAITAAYKEVNGRPLDFKVYLTKDINANANAMADGSVRVYSALMDILNDDELKCVIGHEIGHVAKSHTKQKMQVAYTTRAARGALVMAGGDAGRIAASEVGGFAQELINAQFSQAEETESDEYGFELARKANTNLNGCITALLKLDDGRSHGLVEQMLSSHPEPRARAENLRIKLAALGTPSAPTSTVTVASVAPVEEPRSGASTAEAKPTALTANTGQPVGEVNPGGSSQGMGTAPADTTSKLHVANISYPKLAERDQSHTAAYSVHLASYRSQPQASRALSTFTAILPAAGHSLYTTNVNLHAKGRWTRVMVGGFDDRVSAEYYCENIRTSGQYCQPMRRTVGN